MKLFVPPTNGSGSISSFVITMGVGTDSSTTTDTPDCGNSNDELVQQLIAELIHIVDSILNG